MGTDGSRHQRRLLLWREGVDADALDQDLHVFVYDAADMREGSSGDVRDRLSRILNDHRSRRNLSNARNNWLGANVDKGTVSSSSSGRAPGRGCRVFGLRRVRLR